MTQDDLVPIPGGEFLMGQEDGRDDERPVHRVKVAPFGLCRYQATNADFAAFRKFSFDCATSVAAFCLPAAAPVFLRGFFWGFFLGFFGCFRVCWRAWVGSGGGP